VEQVSTVPISCVVVDDNVHLLDAMSDLLEGEGMDVVAVAHSGIEALETLEAMPTTVIVVDLRLPDLNGLEVARRAVEIARRKTAIVLYTGTGDRELVPEALDAGASAVVLKGPSARNLLEAISTVAAGQVYVDAELRG
jgi:two-component system, NarL family, nitrate/nitrite response regulator NarL